MKTSRILSLTAAAALAAATLTGCSPFLRVGPAVTESREIGDITGVVLDTHGELVISQGEPSLAIHAPDAVLDKLTHRVRDGVLELGREPGAWAFGTVVIRYELTVPSLESIALNGAGEIESSVSAPDLSIRVSGVGSVSVDDLDADSVTVRLSGTGDVRLTGEATSLEAEVNGVGSLDADDLETVDAVVRLRGTGDAEVHVTGTLRAEVSGIGSVRHRGGARVDADVSGIGSVERAD